MTFRFDDISANTDMRVTGEIVLHALSIYPNCRIIFGLSPLCHSNCGQRVFPKVYSAMSDKRNFYRPDVACDIGSYPGWIETAGHGIVHINHQLLSRETQELSILTSCSLAKGKIFIPPWNQWNKETEDICKENGIELIKFEDGWKSAEHNEFDSAHELWYLHPYAWTLEKFKEWLQ